MKKIIFLATFLLITVSATAQNQGTNLYLTISLNETVVVKNVYKYVRNNINNPRMKGCRMDKMILNSSSCIYFMQYPVYYGLDLELTPKQGVAVQTVAISQVASLYPTARTAAQLDLDMQPAIDADYLLPRKNLRQLHNAHTIKYLQSFDKIFVIEYLPDGTAKVVECRITSSH